MPQFIFKCKKCKKEIKKVCSLKCKTTFCPDCKGAMVRQMPKSSKTTVKETVDSVTGISHFDNQEALLEETNKKHFYENDVPRLVASGKYTIEQMIEFDWIFFDIYGTMQIKKYKGQEEA